MNKDFLDILHALFAADAEFLIVGAFAVSVYSEPRATGDLDIWINATPENAKKVYSALATFGAPLDDLTEKDLSSPDVVFQLGLPPNRIDILTFLTGLNFESAWKNHSMFEFMGKQVPLIGKDDLVKNKKALGRPKDLLDVELIEKHTN